MNTPFNLQRFLDAQQRDYAQALREIKNGFKQSHWIWYVFPQLKGLGHSYNSEYYGLDGIDEARAYYDHPVLRERLIEITTALLEHQGKSAVDILSPIDARKVKSCMTLFWLASENPLFKSVLETFYAGQMDNKTVRMCGMTNNNPSNNTNHTQMRYNDNPFNVEHLDFMIVDRAIRYTPRGRFTEDDGGVIALYNFFGRWFTKQFIIDRINYINETSQKEGRHIPAYLEGGVIQKAFQELNELFNKKCKAEDEDDLTQIISIDTEMVLEINNLCYFNEAQKMYGLFKKYLFPEHVSGNWGIYIKTFELQRLEGIPKQLLLFHWEDDGVPQLLCFISVSDHASYSLFGFDYADTNGNDYGEHPLGSYLDIQKDINIDKILHYSGSDYTPLFRMNGGVITRCNPSLIRHRYRLKPLRIPGTSFVFDGKPQYFDKYYDLYHTGNWNAKHAIERGGFNLNG